jgi:N-acetylmuramoyl-L-alanine amidase
VYGLPSVGIGFVVALVLAQLGAVHAGEVLGVSRTAAPVADKAHVPGPSGAEPLTSVTKIRRGTHPGFTRVVLELGAAQEWFVRQDDDGPIRIIIPSVGLEGHIRRMDFSTGLVRSIQPVRRVGGVEILIVCDSRPVSLQTQTLTDPDRLVLDVMPASPLDGGRAGVQGKKMPGSASLLASSAQPVPVDEPGSVQRLPRAVSTLPSPSGSTASTPAGAPREEKHSSLTVVLDPGHGGHDTGAIGPSGLMEKDVVLDLALRLRRLLQERLGLRVLMTRSEDVFVPLPERSAFANRVKADFLVSLHVNAATKRGAVGVETFFFTREPSDNDARASAQRENLVIENSGSAGKDLDSLLKTTLADMAVTRDMKESSNLAEGVLSSLEKILRVENRGVKSGPFYVLATAAMPAVLVESAFITNPGEERKLQRDEYRERIARALFEGIAAYKIRYEQRLGLRNAASGVGS